MARELAFIKDARTTQVRGRLMLAFTAHLHDGTKAPQVISCDAARPLFELDDSRKASELDFTLIWVETGATGGTAAYAGPYYPNARRK